MWKQNRIRREKENFEETKKKGKKEKEKEHSHIQRLDKRAFTTSKHKHMHVCHVAQYECATPTTNKKYGCRHCVMCNYYHFFVFLFFIFFFEFSVNRNESERYTNCTATRIQKANAPNPYHTCANSLHRKSKKNITFFPQITRSTPMNVRTYWKFVKCINTHAQWLCVIVC